MSQIDDILKSGTSIEAMNAALLDLVNSTGADTPLTVRESHAAEGIWSWMCRHGRHVDACWECMV